MTQQSQSQVSRRAWGLRADSWRCRAAARPSSGQITGRACEPCSLHPCPRACLLSMPPLLWYLLLLPLQARWAAPGLWLLRLWLEGCTPPRWMSSAWGSSSSSCWWVAGLVAGWGADGGLDGWMVMRMGGVYVAIVAACLTLCLQMHAFPALSCPPCLTHPPPALPCRWVASPSISRKART